MDKDREKPERIPAISALFQYIYEEAFFQGKQELLLLSPTGEQESISITAFKELMNLLEVYGGEEENNLF